jgi:hypothetical protein
VAPVPSGCPSGDVVGPLELLYEFDELVRGNPGCQPLNELHRRVVLLGPWTSNIGTPEQCPKNWDDDIVGRHKHTIIAGSDPSTGPRFASSVYPKHRLRDIAQWDIGFSLISLTSHPLLSYCSLIVMEILSHVFSGDWTDPPFLNLKGDLYD